MPRSVGLPLPSPASALSAALMSDAGPARGQRKLPSTPAQKQILQGLASLGNFTLASHRMSREVL